MEAVTYFTFLGSMITADGDSSHEIKTPASWDESNDNPRQHLKKQRHHLADKSPYSQSYIFTSSNTVYGSGSWTIKKADRQRFDAFKLWCWGRLLRVLWTTKRTNLSILEEINPECSLEGHCLLYTSPSPRD